MGLIEIASNNSFWRGVDYYNRNMVISWNRCADNCYEGVVNGSNDEKYNVHVDKMHPRKSTCTCPFANDKRVICKHMLAVCFTAEPDMLEEYLEEIKRQEQEWEEEIERREIEHEQELMKKAKSMSKSELIEELVLAWLQIEELEKQGYYY
jgi:hypothetical protein